MKKNFITAVLLFAAVFANAQYRVNAGASAGSGASMISFGVEREFNIVSKKLHVNPGIRFNAFNGSNLDYITAPAEYTVNDDHVDTVRFSNANSNFANLYVRIGYDISDKFSLSFDIDIVGVSFGAEQDNLFVRPGKSQRDYYNMNPSLLISPAKANPTSINALLIGDNDLGSLNSTLNLTYNFTKRIAVDAGVGLVFTEYTTDYGIGYDQNDRFRNKNMMGYLGVSYLLGDK